MTDKFILNDKKEIVACEDLIVWARWMQTADRQVAKTVIGDDVVVSTVFLGLDHNFYGGPPLVFETMVFRGKTDGEMDRYSTYEEALAGHDIMVQMVKLSNE